MTTMPKPLSSFETRGAKDADPATASLVEDIGLARETDYFLMADQLTDPEKEIFAKVRAFGEAEILPMVNAHIMNTLLPHSRLYQHSGGHIDLVHNAVELVPVIEAFLHEHGERP